MWLWWSRPAGESGRRRRPERPRARVAPLERLECRALLAGGTISGHLFDDANGNGAQEPGEPALSGWTAILETVPNGKFDDGERSTSTDLNGDFAFDGLEVGAYYVSMLVPAGWEQLWPGAAGAANGHAAPVLAGPGQVPRIIDGTPIPHVIDGTIVEPDHPSVGIIGDRSGNYCSGTLISPQHVLTAAHCSSQVGHANGRFTITAGTRTVYSSSRITIHPRWSGGVGSDASHDLAIWELSSAVVGVEPSTLLRSAPSLGESVTLVGYGHGGTGTSGHDGVFGTKRSGTNTIDRVTSRLVHWSFDRTDPPESNTAPGDSGGANFVARDGSMILAAVTSGGEDRQGRFGDEAFSTRVDAYAGWIDAVLAGTGQTSCSTAPALRAIPAPAPGAPRFLATTGLSGDLPRALIELRMSPSESLLVGETAAFTSSIDFSPSGVLYGAGAALNVLDPATGSRTTIGQIRGDGLPSLVMNSIAFAPDGALYGAALNGRLYRIDPATARATEIGPMPGSVRGIDFDPAGRLFALTPFDLYELDPTTALARSHIGGLTALVSGDMDFAHDGRIYAVDSVDRVVYAIDPATARQVPVGSYSLEITGIASHSPDPAADRPGLYAASLPCPDQSLAGANFAARRIAAQPALTVRDVHAIRAGKKLVGLKIIFSDPISPELATDRAHYQLLPADSPCAEPMRREYRRPIAQLIYDDAEQSVTMLFRKPMTRSTAGKLVIADGALRSTDDHALDGDADGTRGGAFVHVLNHRVTKHRDDVERC